MENGKLPRSVLARVYHPTLTLFMAREPAAAWNSFRLYLVDRGHDAYAEGRQGCYRDLAHQKYLYHLYLSGRGNLAAVPGTSNHGWGEAIDLATPAMRTLLDEHGAQFGYQKQWSDAPSEWWHIKYASGHWRRRPNPGINAHFPILTIGSGGPGQGASVRQMQGRLHYHLGNWAATPRKDSGNFTSANLHALRYFQKAIGHKTSGVTDPITWRALRARKPSRSKRPRSQEKHHAAAAPAHRP